MDLKKNDTIIFIELYNLTQVDMSLHSENDGDNCEPLEGK